jgi:hypothetical protein
MCKHKPSHAKGKRCLADPRFAADQPGVRNAPAPIGIEQRLLGLGMTEQRRGFAWMRQGVFVVWVFGRAHMRIPWRFLL